MTLTDCQLLSIVAQLGTFAAAAERMHITPSAVSHAVSGVEAECGFPLFTRTKSGVTLTAAAEKLMPAIQQMLASSESLEQSIAQINESSVRLKTLYHTFCDQSYLYIGNFISSLFLCFLS